MAFKGFRRRSKKAKAFYVNLNRQIGYRETHSSKMRHNNSKASYIITKHGKPFHGTVLCVSYKGDVN